MHERQRFAQAVRNTEQVSVSGRHVGGVVRLILMQGPKLGRDCSDYAFAIVG